MERESQYSQFGINSKVIAMVMLINDRSILKGAQVKGLKNHYYHALSFFCTISSL